METLTIPELSKYLHTSNSTIRRLIKIGDLPYFKVGGIIKFNKKSIDNWVHQQELNNFKDSFQEVNKNEP